MNERLSRSAVLQEPAEVHAYLRVVHLDFCLRSLLGNICNILRELDCDILSGETDVHGVHEGIIGQ